MNDVIHDLIPPIALRDSADSFWQDVKASELLDRVFAQYFEQMQLPNLMRKTAYHRLAALVKAEELDQEVTDVLDQIVEVANASRAVWSLRGGDTTRPTLGTASAAVGEMNLLAKFAAGGVQVFLDLEEDCLGDVHFLRD